MGERRSAHKVLVGKPEGKRSFGRTRRRWQGSKWREWTGLIWLRIQTSGGVCERGNETSGCIKWREFG
jgi:hypothetical protein